MRRLLRVVNAEHKLGDERGGPIKYFFPPSKSLKKAANSPKTNYLQRVDAFAFGGRSATVDPRAGCRKHVAKTFLVSGFIRSFLFPFFAVLFIARVSNRKAMRRYSTENREEPDRVGFRITLITITTRQGRCVFRLSNMRVKT